MCGSIEIPDEFLEALYLFAIRNSKHINVENTGRDAGDFLSKAHSSLGLLQMFVTSIPLRSITRLVHSDSQWRINLFSGGEDWFVQYKTSWKKLFDRKWESWVQDCKKEALREKLQNNFQLKEFPLLPERPWASLWGGLRFRYELTAGFLYWYFRKVFPPFELHLKIVMMEGDFIQKQNRIDFTESFNNLIEISIELDSLHRRLQTGGDIGILFMRLINDKTRTLQGQAKAEDMLKSVEGDLGGILYKFGEACRHMDMLLNGILQTDKKDSRYDSLSNLSELQGSNNAIFRAQLAKAHASIVNAYDLIKELEPIDSP
jgi:hypothetical protein